MLNLLPLEVQTNLLLGFFRNNSVIKSLTGAGSGAFTLTVPNCTNSADKYYVTVNNDAEKTLKGSLYVNTRRD